MIGTTIEGRYVVKRFIGRGGMGSVYEGEQVKLGRHVAIKVMAHELAAEHRERFRREARLASRVIHEHVAQVFDVSTTPDGNELIVMEYVEGRELGDVMAEGPMEPARVIAISRAILAGLAAIHEQGIVHRDVKPNDVDDARQQSRLREDRRLRHRAWARRGIDHVYTHDSGPRDVKKSKRLECDACTNANTRVYRGTLGAPCTGYYWHTGEQMQGTLQQCE